MPGDLPAGVTLADIDGPIMPRCEFPGCGEEHNDDDNNGLCPDHQPEPDNEDAQEILAMIRAGHWPPLPEIKPITTVLRKTDLKTKAQILYESELSACKQAKACDPDCNVCISHPTWQDVPRHVRTFYQIAARNFLRRLRKLKT